MNLVPIVSRI
uniref:Uncharacterized protein n=1 Tax=Anguilla anguilla TaxID=7936 RepID=A0A0E9TIA9_ANGAN